MIEKENEIKAGYESHSVLKLGCLKMIEEKLYLKPELLFDWSKSITERDGCVSNHTALTIKRYISEVEDHDAIFDSVIDYGKQIEIVSKVQTNSKGYAAAVVISMYLDTQGLGYKKDTESW